jgi:hypothetical protein
LQYCLEPCDSCLLKVNAAVALQQQPPRKLRLVKFFEHVFALQRAASLSLLIVTKPQWLCDLQMAEQLHAAIKQLLLLRVAHNLATQHGAHVPAYHVTKSH